MLSCDHGNLKFMQALKKKKIEPIIPLGSKGTFDPEIVGADWWEEPQELTVIGWMVRKVTYEGIDYTWHEYLLYKPRHPFYWLIYNDGHWSFGQSVPAGGRERRPDLGPLRRKPLQSLRSRRTGGDVCAWRVLLGSQCGRARESGGLYLSARHAFPRNHDKPRRGQKRPQFQAGQEEPGNQLHCQPIRASRRNRKGV